MTIQKFEDLAIIARFGSRCLSNSEKNRDYDFKSQIQRAAISVMNNIAEGFDRSKAAKNNKQFVYFLWLLRGC